MMMRLLLSSLLVLLLSYGASSALQKARYDNYKVYSVKVQNFDQQYNLQGLEANNAGYQFWSSINIGGLTDIMVPPHKFPEFEQLMANLGLETFVKIQNVQFLIDNEQPKMQPRSGFGWTSYHTIEEQYDWLDKIVSENENLTNYEYGTSYEGRVLRGVKLSRKAGNKAIFIEANIHAREWITSATATWLLNTLLTNNSDEVQSLATSYDWIFVPIVNVDGFAYSHSMDRIWRKTRQVYTLQCTGADPNRNFDFHWMSGGASNNPCYETFGGSHAFSEVESKALADFYLSFADDVALYLSFHSYSQLLLLPFGHTFDVPSNYDDMMTIGLKGMEALKSVYGTEYTTGTTASTIYIASGGSTDWAYGQNKTKLAYTFEMRDNGQYGFVLPANQIIPNAEEVFEGIRVMIAEADVQGYFNKN